MLIKQMSEFTGKKEKELFDAMERDNWMNPTEAKEFGLIDNILERK
jgi:ATP-dependent Clp protease protease subunit